MKRHLLLLSLFLPLLIHSQTPIWMGRQSLPDTANRTFATSLAIGNKILLVGGKRSNLTLADVWEYNVTLNTWAKKTDFPGGPRSGATAFTIGQKGYLMCGSNYNQFYHDVWEYDQATDAWTKKADFPGVARHEAAGFSLAGKGYLGTGYSEFVGPNGVFKAAYNDFWEYNPGADVWVQKANVPGANRGWAVAASAGGKGYLGLGGDDTQTLSYNNFYEYSPTNNTWTTLAPYPLTLSDAMCFVYNQELHICGGINFSNGIATSAHYKYEASGNNWSVQASLIGGASMGGVGISSDNRAYTGTGYNSIFNEKNDWREFGDPLVADVSSTQITEAKVHAYPNPGNGIFTIRYEYIQNNDIRSAMVTDVAGAAVIFKSKLNGQLLEVELTEPACGIYFLTVETDSEIVRSKLIVK